MSDTVARLREIADEGELIHCLSWQVIAQSCREAAAEIEALKSDMSRQMDSRDKAEAAAGELFTALNLILPLAKGYAAAHRVGSNDEYIAAAEITLERHALKASPEENQ